MWGLISAAVRQADPFGPMYQQSGVRQDPYRHVCRGCEFAWCDTNQGDSACEWCGAPCPLSRDVLTKACSAPAPYWKLPAEDDE
jgi:hypothetical protein